MKITDVRVRLVSNEKLKAFASITIDACFVVHDIKVLDGKGGLFIQMPKRKTPEGEYVDIAHPIKSETRTEIEKAVLEAYQAETEKNAE